MTRSMQLLVCAAVALWPSVEAASAADAVEDFFRGKTISLWVGYGAGGGYDNTARLLAMHLGDHVPGKPKVVVQNIPGAGSLLSANNLFNVAPKDGTVIGMFSSTVALLPLYEDPNAKFETRKFNWIGNLHRDAHSCAVWNGAGQDIKTLADLMATKKTVAFGADGSDAPLARWPAFLKNVLGANLSVIAGYKGTREINLAMQAGELGGSCGMFESTLRTAYLSDYQSGRLKLIVQTGYQHDAPFFGDTPNLYSYLKTDEQVRMARLVFGVNEITRPIAAPPGVPPDRVAALRRAFDEAVRDPALLEDARRAGLDLDPVSAKDLIEEFDVLLQTPRDIVRKASEATNAR